MKKKSVSKIAKGKFRKVLVFRGSKEKTIGGLQKSDLIKNKHGRIVSKKASLRAKKNSGWTTAIQKARKALGLKGFVAIKKGSDLYKKAKELYQCTFVNMPRLQLGAWGCLRPWSAVALHGLYYCE